MPRAADELDGLRTLLGRILATAEAGGRQGSVVEATFFGRWCTRRRATMTPRSTTSVGRLVLGVPVGYRRLFLDEGVAAEELLEHLAQSADAAGAGATGAGGEATTAADHAATVLRARHPAKDDGSIAPAGATDGADTVAAGGEGLSERELEVLRLLATDLSGPEIARRLFVSLNTLRTHTKHIFTKLGVNTRRAAVTRGAELDLL